MNKYLLKLYVTGNTSRNELAIANLQHICSEKLNNEYKIKIIDVLEDPKLAEDDKIMVTPILIKELPLPICRIVGDISDMERVLLTLDLR